MSSLDSKNLKYEVKTILTPDLDEIKEGNFN